MNSQFYVERKTIEAQYLIILDIYQLITFYFVMIIPFHWYIRDKFLIKNVIVFMKLFWIWIGENRFYFSTFLYDNGSFSMLPSRAVAKIHNDGIDCLIYRTIADSR